MSSAENVHQRAHTQPLHGAWATICLCVLRLRHDTKHAAWTRATRLLIGLRARASIPANRTEGALSVMTSNWKLSLLLHSVGQSSHNLAQTWEEMKTPTLYGRNADELVAI